MNGGWVSSAARCRAAAAVGRRGVPARGGFTLAEMIVVLVVLGILAGSAVVSLRGRRERQALQAAAREVAAVLRLARGEAEMSRRTCRIAFDANLRAYHVESQGPDGQYRPLPGKAGKPRSLADRVRVQAVVVDGTKVEPPPEALEFLPSGRGFHGRIELTDGHGRIRAVEMFNGTGQVRVLD